MNAKAWIPLVVAIALGLVAALFASRLTRSGPVNVNDMGDKVQVVAAARTINPGDELKTEDLALSYIGAKDAPEGTFLAVADLTGRIANVPMVKGQAVLEVCLAPIGAAAGIQALVPEGMRLISLEINEFSGLSGMLTPGSFVDIISAIKSENDELMARTIAENVQVKAVGTRINPQEKPDAEAPMHRAVTLLVTPQQAETLELAVVMMRNTGAGLPWLVLRAPHDKAEGVSEGITLTDLRGGKPSLGQLFETRPVEMTEGPTTRPIRLIADETPAKPESEFEQREVTIIRGGVETKVMMQIKKPMTIITGNETGFINK